MHFHFLYSEVVASFCKSERVNRPRGGGVPRRGVASTEATSDDESLHTRSHRTIMSTQEGNFLETRGRIVCGRGGRFRRCHAHRFEVTTERGLFEPATPVSSGVIGWGLGSRGANDGSTKRGNSEGSGSGVEEIGD